MNKKFTVFLPALSAIAFLISTQVIYSQNMGQAARININKINLPFNNKGNIAAVQVPDNGRTNGFYEGHEFVFSADIILSGYTNDSLWANATGYLERSFQPGTVGIAPDDTLASIYRVGVDDPPFGESWQDWRYAVDLGADYYDGDNNGEFDPVDLNNNGIWDPNEDKPDITGDECFWCVYNDGVPVNERRWRSEPQGIEISQTIFAFTSPGVLENVVFVRYRIKNTGLLADTIRNVYFGHFADVDIGEVYGCELTRIGCDTLRNATYGYLAVPSPQDWGDNPPCFLTDLLTGPLSYLPGRSFEDLNNNNIYDENIDMPLDTAFSFRGPLGAKIYPGAQNLSMTASIFIINAAPGYTDPSNITEARNYLQGLSLDGELVDPCIWPAGQVFGEIPCSEINPHYWCSGDPVTKNGWLSSIAANVRKIQSTGPFTLAKNQEIEILIGFIVGRGDSALGSVTVAKEISDETQTFSENNFGYPFDLNGDHGPHYDPDFELFQNYPNPFNSTTTIRYMIPGDGVVTIELFDVLGQKIKTILNKFQKANRYEVKYNASTLSSGIYIYRMRVNDFITSKKMVLIK